MFTSMLVYPFLLPPTDFDARMWLIITDLKFCVKFVNPTIKGCRSFGNQLIHDFF